MADANVAVYPVDSRGVDVGFPGADSKVDPSGIPKGKQDMAEELVNTGQYELLASELHARLCRFDRSSGAATATISSTLRWVNSSTEKSLLNSSAQLP